MATETRRDKLAGVNGLEWRNSAIDRVEGRTLHGYAARYNQWSHPIFKGTKWEFKEQIAPGAFDDSVREQSVSLFWQHDRHQVLANQSSGTLKLYSDETGLRYEATLGDTPQDDLYLDRVARGLVREMSFGFRVRENGDEWTKDEKQRTLRSVELREISVVERGAYPGTSAAKRSRSDTMEYRSKILALTAAAFTAALATASYRDLKEARNELSEQLRESLTEGAETTEEQREEMTERLDALRTEMSNRQTGAVNAAARLQREDPSKQAERRDNQLDSREYREKFDNFVRRGGPAPEVREFISTTSSGLAVPKLYQDAIEKYAQANLVVMNKCNFKRNVQGKPNFRISDFRHNTKVSAVTTEASPSSTSTDPGLTEVAPTPYPVIAHTQHSTTVMVASDFDVEELIVDELGKKMMNGLEDYLSTGSGSSQPTGIFLSNTSTNQQQTTAAHGSGAGWDSQVDDLANTLAMAYKLIPAAYWAGMEWFMSQDYFARLASKLDGSNRPLMQASGVSSISGGPVFLLHGRPVNVCAFAPGRQTAASVTVPCVLGNLRESFKALEWGGIPTLLRDEITTPGRVITRMQTHVDSKITKLGYISQHRVTLT